MPQRCRFSHLTTIHSLCSWKPERGQSSHMSSHRPEEANSHLLSFVQDQSWSCALNAFDPSGSQLQSNSVQTRWPCGKWPAKSKCHDSGWAINSIPIFVNKRIWAQLSIQAWHVQIMSNVVQPVAESELPTMKPSGSQWGRPLNCGSLATVVCFEIDLKTQEPPLFFLIVPKNHCSPAGSFREGAVGFFKLVPR